MVCLLSMPGLAIPPYGLDGELVRVTNHLRAASGGSNPLDAEPWALQLKGGGICFGNWPDLKAQRHGGRPPLLYSCGSSVTKGFVDRTTPYWWIATASGAAAQENRYSRSTIVSAWFITNSPVRSQ